MMGKKKYEALMVYVSILDSYDILTQSTEQGVGGVGSFGSFITGNDYDIWE